MRMTMRSGVGPFARAAGLTSPPGAIVGRVEVGEAHADRGPGREAEPAAGVELALADEVVEPARLAPPVIQRLALVELHPPELVEDQRPTAPHLDRYLAVEVVGHRHLRERAGLVRGQVDDLDVAGDDLLDDQPVRSDPQGGTQRLDLEVPVGLRSSGVRFCHTKRKTSSRLVRSAVALTWS